MDWMKNLDCNQIKIFINLEIIGEEKLYIYFKKFDKNNQVVLFLSKKNIAIFQLIEFNLNSNLGSFRPFRIVTNLSHKK